MNYRMLYKARCPECGTVRKAGETDTFMTMFFLPKFCNGCGEHRPKWIVASEKQKRRKARGIFGKLGFKIWVTIDESEDVAND